MPKTSLPSFFCQYSNNCYECCKQTEMTLTEEEVKAIEALGFKIEEFIVLEDFWLVLRNIDKHCFFLKDGKCSIYDVRPKGCRYYPLILDLEKDQIIIDNDCPHVKYVNKEVFHELSSEIRNHVIQLLLEQQKRRERKNKRKKRKI